MLLTCLTLLLVINYFYDIQIHLCFLNIETGKPRLKKSTTIETASTSHACQEKTAARECHSPSVSLALVEGPQSERQLY